MEQVSLNHGNVSRCSEMEAVSRYLPERDRVFFAAC